MKTRIRRVRLRIRYERRSDLVALVALLALVLATATFLGCLAWGSKQAAASGPQASPAASAHMRKYYLTQSAFDGDEVLTACAPGYHMASLWEIMDTSKLEYNTDLGFTRADSGAGPPTLYYGWVRTGWDSEGSSGIYGQDNCSAWTDDSAAPEGSMAYLLHIWTSGFEDMHVWGAGSDDCHESNPVWCVEDTGSSGYLPLALKD